ncbi:hypothetical protein FDI24_gp149 [Acidovorax phage ACP17]|uniref:Uncharacterized protein n=1 Tax=Acidovorax phage ACP17 TaxID=2010329 RepID=A0A218M311_9CAUD|nr:hypothetical protein FDI24_gp149 [Acidovorax phage ACP17]ASD50430.1 hypothetical protein [Acidovorax phage ACP17]
MTKSSNIQQRGHCQCCGRQQAVIAGTGFMAKHGYTVENGWFHGVCSGHHYVPVEVSRVQLDKLCEMVLTESASLDLRVKDLQEGVEVPKAVVKQVYNPKTSKFEDVSTPWADATPWAKRDFLETMIYRLKSRASAGRSWVAQMERIADTYHGQPLMDVVKTEGPEKIVVGEQRKAPSGMVVTVTDIRGARVYWQGKRPGEERVMKGWTGSTAFRKFEKV